MNNLNNEYMRVNTHTDNLPSEHELLTPYGASRETVRKALDLLANDGMIQKLGVRGPL